MDIKYVTLSHIVKETKWFKRDYRTVGLSRDFVDIYCSRIGVIEFLKNDIERERSKYRHFRI